MCYMRIKFFVWVPIGCSVVDLLAMLSCPTFSQVFSRSTRVTNLVVSRTSRYVQDRPLRNSILDSFFYFYKQNNRKRRTPLLYSLIIAEKNTSILFAKKKVFSLDPDVYNKMIDYFVYSRYTATLFLDNINIR